MEDLKKSLKMPLFGNTFSPKKIPPRKCASLSSLHATTLDQVIDISGQFEEKRDNNNHFVFKGKLEEEVELGLEYGPPVMNIGGQSWKFEEGQWITESGGNGSGRELQRLKKRNVQLEEENNLLKLKIEILLDMLTETTVDNHLMGKEVEEIKTQHRRKK